MAMVLAMHAPDGFLNPVTALVTAIISVAVVALAMRHSRQQLADKAIPLAGITAAFIFAAQMFNFPVAAGTTGHLLGGALAAVLLGPSVGVVVVTIVVVVQALVFADGGLTALGYNVLNMAIVPA
ncbi:MAG TPA: energy-coupling factor ABC transporter permease, partial [Acidimicrobiia bacterium]